MDSHQLLRMALVVAGGAGVYYFSGGYDPHGHKQLKKPLRIRQIGQARTARISGGQVDVPKMEVNSMVLHTRDSTQYTLKDLPADDCFLDDADGLIDYVSRRRRRQGMISSKWTYWKKVPFDEKLYQMLTERYERVVQGQMDVGDVLR